MTSAHLGQHVETYRNRESMRFRLPARVVWGMILWVQALLLPGYLVLAFPAAPEIARLEVRSAVAPTYLQLPVQMLGSSESEYQDWSQGVVRLGRCPAAFVSESGLAATSYGCARSMLENLVDSLFHAASRGDELPIQGVEALLLVDSRDPSTLGEHGDSTTVIEHVEIGNRVRALVYRRYTDIRLVFMPEPEIASYNEPKMFPNAAFDVAFFRVYDGAGALSTPEVRYMWSQSGVTAGDSIHVVSGPEITSVGVVEGFPHNGSIAPPHTSLYGLFDLHHAHQTDSLWTLPDKWIAALDSINLAKQIQFASTARCDGRTIGAPVLNQYRELVGIVSGERGSEIMESGHSRCITVSAEGVLEALRTVYDARGLVQEIGRQARFDL